MPMPKRLDVTAEILSQEYVINHKPISQIAKDLHCSTWLIHDRLKEFDLPIRRHYNVGLKADFSRTIELAYVIGVVTGDGWVSRNCVSLGVRDQDFALAFYSALEALGFVPSFKRYGRNYAVWVCNTNFCQWLKEQTLTTLTGIITKSAKEMRAFLRGFYDSDGSFQMRYRKYDYKAIVFYNTDIRLLRFAKHLLHELGFGSILRLTKKAGRRSVTKSGKVIVSRKHAYRLGIYKLLDVYMFLTTVGSNIERKRGKKWLKRHQSDRFLMKLLPIPTNGAESYSRLSARTST